MRRSLLSALSSSAGAAAASPPAAVLERVVAGDVDGALSCALLPARARASAFAFRALNLELAAVAGASRGSAAAAALRLAFWREVVRGAAGFGAGGAASAHPLFAPLRGADLRS